MRPAPIAVPLRLPPSFRGWNFQSQSARGTSCPLLLSRSRHHRQPTTFSSLVWCFRNNYAKSARILFQIQGGRRELVNTNDRRATQKLEKKTAALVKSGAKRPKFIILHFSISCRDFGNTTLGPRSRPRIFRPTRSLPHRNKAPRPPGSARCHPPAGTAPGELHTISAVPCPTRSACAETGSYPRRP